MSPSNVAKVREVVRDNLGKKVRIRSHVGKRKFCVCEGVLQETYPSIFLVKVGETSEEVQIVSYSYTDVITKEVQMMFC